MARNKPLILFIDAYDSFSNNIISLLETALEASVRTVKIDNFLLASDEALRDELKYYTAVVCGPGPGHPINKSDVGIMARIWHLSDQNLVPVLGICLGFQSLCVAFGGKVEKMRGPQHGMIRRVTHVGETAQGEGSIFEGVGEIQATLYQSLHADIGHSSASRSIFQNEKWNSTEQCPDLVPLAWAEWDGITNNNSGRRDEKILLAVRHKDKPFWALQYHPESICTNGESGRVIENWFRAAEAWNETTRQEDRKPLPRSVFMDEIIGQAAVRKSLLDQSEEQSFLHSCHPGPTSSEEDSIEEVLGLHLDEVYRCQTVNLPAGMSAPDILELMQDVRRDQIILDSSNSHETSAQVRGRYSMIALDADHALKFDYKAGLGKSEKQTLHASWISNTDRYNYRPLSPKASGGIWAFVAEFLEKRRIPDGHPESPFWGGFIGYTSYEMGLGGINVKLRLQTSRKGLDLCLIWVTRSIVLDHERGLVYLQDVSKKGSEGSMPQWITAAAEKLESQLAPNIPQGVDRSWHEIMGGGSRTGSSSESSSFSCEDPFVSTLRRPSGSRFLREEKELMGKSLPLLNGTSPQPSLDPSSRTSMESNPELSFKQSEPTITSPAAKVYESKVRRCQGYIQEGDSYELCLTDQTTVQRHRLGESLDDRYIRKIDHCDKALCPCDDSKSVEGDSWLLYRKLRTQQPAPFAAFIRLAGTTLISASPERFLKWDEDGQCELRPMKGTVRKSDAVSTIEQAKALLDVPKERAENLMIVDLVRHDLHGICGSGNVSVPRLMVVEEYKSVFQMITVVEGRIPPPRQIRHNGVEGRDTQHRRTGLDVLAASLPPGSMTGAPKKRSCEILQEIEDKPRGLYSGVVGYMDIGGRGDWSVTIRSMFRFDYEDIPEEDGKEGVIETWHIGAGGAVTSLSTPEGEREEMLTKLNGTLGVFK